MGAEGEEDEEDTEERATTARRSEEGLWLRHVRTIARKVSARVQATEAAACARSAAAHTSTSARRVQTKTFGL